jgi:hypothetical protein
LLSEHINVVWLEAETLLKGAEKIMKRFLVAMALVSVAILLCVVAYAAAPDAPGAPAPAAPVAAAPAPTPGTPPPPAGETKAPGAVHMNVIDLIFVSFIGLSLIIESFIALRRSKLLPAYFVAELEELFENEQYEEAMQLCESEDNLLSRTVAAGLSKVDKGWASVEEGMAEAITQSSLAMNQNFR